MKSANLVEVEQMNTSNVDGLGTERGTVSMCLPSRSPLRDVQ